MSNNMTAAARTGNTALSTRNKAGLVLAGLLGLADIVSLGAIGQPDSGEAGPPVPVLIASAILGVITLIVMVYTWRTANRAGARLVAGTRVLSAITSLPAFFVSDVSPGLVALAAGGIIVTLIAVGLVLSRPAQPAG
jgi:hypothetical protein